MEAHAQPLLPNGEPLPSLPAAGREVAAIARLAPSGAATVLRGEPAREDEVRARLGGHTIVHFATHAVVSDARPLDSFLPLGPGGAADGRLTAEEI